MILNIFVPALLLISEASAQVNTKSLVTCLTKQGPKATSPVKTVSKILTLPFYAYRVTTSTPSRTTTPATATITVSTTDTILTTTTLPVETDTATTTFTDLQTEVITENTIITVTSTSISTFTTTSTTTIAASAGFIPVESSIPGSRKRNVDQEAPEAALAKRQATKQVKISVKNGKPFFEPARYPQAVTCAGVVAVVTTQIRTRTASTTRVVTASTPVVTSTSSFTTTVTITETPQRAATTTTVTASPTTTVTTTVTGTATLTQVNTVTEIAPQATFYAACAEDNIITTYNGQPFESANSGDGTETQGNSAAASAYECCVTCVNTPGCGASAYLINAGICITLSPQGTCSQNTVPLFANPGSSSQFAFSNGYCGRTSL